MHPPETGFLPDGRLRLPPTVLAALAAFVFAIAGSPILRAAPTPFVVVSYNVENYLVAGVGTRQAKPEAQRDRVASILAGLRPDVVALVEVGGTNALLDLQERLRRNGTALPNWELVPGHDEAIQVALLSRFPVVARRPHTNDAFLLGGRRLRTSRGILEADIEPHGGYRFTLFAAHLKSKRTSAVADESEIREQEARVLRNHVERRLREQPGANVLVCGDFNDTRDSRAIRILVGAGSNLPLTDTRPAERIPGAPASAGRSRREVTWTHFYAKEDTYSRFDYVLLSPGMTREWRREGSYLPVAADWGEASDHRPVVTEFQPEDR